MRRIIFEVLNSTEAFEFTDNYTVEDIDNELKVWAEWQINDARWEEEV